MGEHKCKASFPHFSLLGLGLRFFGFSTCIVYKPYGMKTIKRTYFFARFHEKLYLYHKDTKYDMRVLIVNTSEKTGGAAVASNRLLNALNNNGVKAKMLVRDKETDHITVVGLRGSLWQRWNFLWERWCIFCHLHFSKKHLFEIDIANVGTDITSLPEFKKADVIHLEWINQGMLSLAGIRKIIASGKAVVWTMHDLWPASAICHYARSCTAFKTGCHHCRLLQGGGSSNDLSSKVWKRKSAVYRDSDIRFVACSRWLEQQARQSGLLQGLNVVTIPNPIDTGVFHPLDKQAARLALGIVPNENRKIILFVSQRVTDERKGVSYFIEAVSQLVSLHPELREQIAVAILGGHAEDIVPQLPVPAYPLGYVNDEKTIVNAYNAADVFVLPSLEDNLPNTLMEAMACGVPCVSFHVGGIPEMIDHQTNGYVARFKDAADLMCGIRWILTEADYAALSKNAVQKVNTSYSQRSVALKYADVYEHAMACKHYRL